MLSNSNKKTTSRPFGWDDTKTQENAFSSWISRTRKKSPIVGNIIRLKSEHHPQFFVALPSAGLHGHFISIVPKGATLTAKQKDVRTRLKGWNYSCYLARSANDAIDYVKRIIEDLC